MSNYDLQSQLSQLESELRELERYNAQLRGELSTIERGVSRANKELVDYNDFIRNNLERCNGSMISSHQRVIDSIEVQAEIERLYVRFKQVELANKKIRAANNVKYYDFSNYRTVRKIVQGIMDNLDVNMVSDKTITKSVEKNHLQTPDYWLTCTLISIMAWKNDDRDLADRAIARAIRFDKKNSAVFFMLFNLRMGRNEAALKWFLTFQECEWKGSDQRTFLMLFSLISKTLNDHVDEGLRGEVSAFIRKVIDANRKAAGYSQEAVINQICRYFNRMQPADQLEYAMLRRYCTDFPQMSDTMLQAKTNIPMLEFINRILHVPAEQKNAFLKGYIDELIALPNQTEKDVYDEIAYNEMVIRYEGEVEEAKEAFASEQKKKASDLNLIAEMIDWIYERDAQDVNGQIRLNMFTLTKDIQQEAVDAHTAAYRKSWKNVCTVAIGDYTASVNFRRETEEYDKVASFFTGRRDVEIAAIKSWKAFVGLGIGGAAAIGAFFAGYWLFAVALIGAGYGVGSLLVGKAQKRHLQQMCDESIRSTCDILRQLFREFDAYQAEFDGYDGYYDQIREALGQF